MHQHREIEIVAFLEFLAFADCFCLILLAQASSELPRRQGST
jgi:hypothetical protein